MKALTGACTSSNSADKPAILDIFNYGSRDDLVKIEEMVSGKRPSLELLSRNRNRGLFRGGLFSWDILHRVVCLERGNNVWFMLSTPS